VSAPSHHGLSSPRRSDEGDVVSARGGDLQGTTPKALATKLTHIWCACLGDIGLRNVCGREPALKNANHLCERPDNRGVESRNHCRLWVCGRWRQETHCVLAGEQRQVQHALGRLDRAIERQFTKRRRSGYSRSGRRPLAASTPMAIGRSYDVPRLGTLAGARLTVTRCAGNLKPELRIALRTRSRLSRTLGSGSPTMLKAGRPNDTSTSTSIKDTSTPNSEAERNRASTHRPPQERLHERPSIFLPVRATTARWVPESAALRRGRVRSIWADEISAGWTDRRT